MWLGLARKGDGEAQYLMGSLYAEPRFADINRAESYRWYYLASLNGHAGATETLHQLDRQISAADRRAAMALVRGDEPAPSSDK
jgi:TPR repeat protein